jgi:hypothetical protein|tara:strand:- start:224 stop:532 length:309 start_codon:yes stop_codon:yes gene_type:complete
MNSLNKNSSSYDESLLTPGYYYTIGTNDGVQFKWCRYHGTKLLNGKAIFVYSTKDGLQLTINPSYHSWTLEHGDGEELLINAELAGEEIEYNQKHQKEVSDG